MMNRRQGNDRHAEQAHIARFVRATSLAKVACGTLEEMLTRVTDAMVEHLDAAFARTWLLEGDSELVLRASSGKYTHLDGQHSRIRIGAKKIGRIASSQAPHLTNDVMHDPEISDREWARREGMVAFAGYPLIVEARLVGVVAMFSRRRLSDSILDALGSMAHGLAGAIERKRAEPALGMLAAIVEGAEHAIISSTLDGLITTWNAGAQRLYGYPPEEIVGRPLAAIVPRDRLPALRQSLSTLGDGKTVEPDETRRLRKDGTAVEVVWTVGPVRDRSGRVVAASHISRDVSERKRLEQQLLESQKMDAVGRLAGGIAHDFNNLLTIITGYAEALRRLLPPDTEASEMVEQIEAAGDRAAELTRQLLAYSRRQVLNPRPASLNQVVSEARNLIGRLIGEDIRLELKLDPGLPAVRVDSTQLLQVLMNLGLNARDAMPTGGLLTIKTSTTPHDHGIVTEGTTASATWVRLTVADTGCGMDEEMQSRIFEPFFTTKPSGGGTGLGLATVYGIVKQSGGAITVRSAPGHGSTFEISLPAHLPARHARPRSTNRAARRGAETLLVVEDEEPLRRLLVRSLKSMGYTVLEAETGECALAVVERHQGIDLLITDVVMPEMSGRQLWEQLHTVYPELRVVFISGYNDDAMLRYGVRSASHNLLQKPFTMATLAQRVRQVLDKADARATNGRPGGPTTLPRRSRMKGRGRSDSPSF